MYTTGEFAKLLGVSIKTLQRWDREGILTAHRSPTNRRMYTFEQLREVLGEKRNRKTIVYCRVSSPAQRPELMKSYRRKKKWFKTYWLSPTRFRTDCTDCVTTKKSCSKH